MLSGSSRPVGSKRDALRASNESPARASSAAVEDQDDDEDVTFIYSAAPAKSGQARKSGRSNQVHKAPVYISSSPTPTPSIPSAPVSEEPFASSDAGLESGFLHYSPSRRTAGSPDLHDLPPPLDLGLSNRAPSPPPQPSNTNTPSEHTRRSGQTKQRPLSSKHSEGDLVILSAKASSKPNVTKERLSPGCPSVANSLSALLDRGRRNIADGSKAQPPNDAMHKTLLDQLDFSDPMSPFERAREEEDTSPPAASTSRVTINLDSDSDQEHQQHRSPAKKCPQRRKAAPKTMDELLGRAPRPSARTALSQPAGRTSATSRSKPSARSAGRHQTSNAQRNPHSVDEHETMARRAAQGKGKAAAIFDDADDPYNEQGLSDDSGQEEEEEDGDDDEEESVLHGPGMLAAVSPSKRDMMLAIALGKSTTGTASQSGGGGKKRKSVEAPDNQEWGFYLPETKAREARKKPSRGRGGWRGRRRGRGKRRG